MAYRGLTIRNSNEQIVVDEITKAHKFLNSTLGVNTNLHFGRTAVWGKNVFHCGCYVNQTKDVIINFRRLYGQPLSIVLEILGHEMRHAFQYENEMLSDTNKSGTKYKSGIWMNKGYTDTYENVPWEVDARNFQKQYAELVINANIIKKELLNVIIPGSIATETLKQETFSEIHKQHQNAEVFSYYLQASTEYNKNVQQQLKALGFKQQQNKRWSYTGNGNKHDAIKKFREIPKNKKCDKKCCYLTIDQLPKEFKRWNKKAINYAWNNLEYLMRKQTYSFIQRVLTINDFVS